MTEDDISKKIAKFESENKQIRICYGGDGTIVSEWRKARGEKKILLPIRNYGQCDEHVSFLDDLLKKPETFSDIKRELKMTLHPLLRCEFDGYDELALSETLITNVNVTEAIRFNVYVNGEKYLSNVISTSFIASTTFGATGYWSSITRTIFRSGFGLAFVAPTVGVSNLILSPTDRASIEFVRECEALVAADKLVVKRLFGKGERIGLGFSSENMPILGLAQFHCNACRALRNGTVLSTQYLK